MLIKNSLCFWIGWTRKITLIKAKKPISTIESKKQNIKDSNGSEKDDDHVSNFVGFQVTTKKDTFEGTITQHVATTTTIDFESELDAIDNDEPSTKDIQ